MTEPVAGAGPEPELDRPSLGRRIAIVAVIVFVAALLGTMLWYRASRDRRAREAAMVSTLDHLVTAQEGIFYDSARYATSLAQLPAFRAAPGVRLEILGASPRSWWGAATHGQLPGRRCVVWVGSPAASMPAAAKAPTQETLPYCYDERAGGAR